MIVHEHAFNDVREANAFVCAINWLNSLNAICDERVGIEPIDIGVGEEDGKPVATAIVNEYEPDDVNTEGYVKEWHDHREHV